jgi:hypothetical protein
MRIALFWRALIGDMEYIRYDPEDMLRWYLALELRGPEEIRELVTERYSSRPMPAVQGIVTKAPHPPTQLVREWLFYHEQKVRVGAYWFAPLGFCILCGLVFPYLYGCQNLQPVNPLFMNPPNIGPQLPTSAQNTPTYGAAPTLQPQTTQSVGTSSSTATPPTQGVVTSTGPTSGGIAGGASGAAPANGVTGPVNSGISSPSGPPNP